MPDPTPDELLSCVADALELPGLTIDAEGDCIFVIEDKLELTLRRTENALFIFAPLFRYQPSSETALAREIARANYMWAGTGGEPLVDDARRRAAGQRNAERTPFARAVGDPVGGEPG